MSTVPPDETLRAVALATTAHGELIDQLDGLGDRFAPEGDSRLPDWTRGHVLAHIVNNAVGLAGLFDSASDGVVGDLYPGGLDQRSAEIEAGALEAFGSQLAALRLACAELEQRWADSDWVGTGRVAAGEFALVDLPFFRLREVLIHHVDLDIGFEFDDLPTEYVRLDLRIMEMRWRARQPMGVSQLPNEARQVEPATRLAWLLGRGSIDGLGPADVL